MAAILVVTVKGNSPQEINKNLSVVDTFMNSNQNVFNLYSDMRVNPRIYYNKDHVITKDIRDITTILKTDKTIAHAVRTVEYSGSLNKV